MTLGQPKRRVSGAGENLLAVISRVAHSRTQFRRCEGLSLESLLSTAPTTLWSFQKNEDIRHGIGLLVTWTAVLVDFGFN